MDDDTYEERYEPSVATGIVAAFLSLEALINAVEAHAPSVEVETIRDE